MTINTPHLTQIPALCSLWKEAFGDSDAYLDAFFRTAFHPERCRVATVNGEIAAALYWFTCTYKEQPIAYLYAVATAKKYQRQGICHKLMEDTHTHLHTLGYKGTVLVPGNENLFRLYETMGYRPNGTLRTFTCTAGTKSVPVIPIDADTFSELRRRFLPENSILQEKENLDFLQTQANFYTGNGFLLTARKEGDTLYVPELLGDTSLAPELVTAFHCTQGTFRTPGSDTTFSMTYSFDDSTPLQPNYFGFAFD